MKIYGTIPLFCDAVTFRPTFAHGWGMLRNFRTLDLPVISKYEDFADNMSEREIIEVANSAGIANGDMYKLYVEKLNGRNSAAHSSTIHITQVQAEGYIDGLIRNGVLLLNI